MAVMINKKTDNHIHYRGAFFGEGAKTVTHIKRIIIRAAGEPRGGAHHEGTFPGSDAANELLAFPQLLRDDTVA